MKREANENGEQLNKKQLWLSEKGIFPKMNFTCTPICYKVTKSHFWFKINKSKDPENINQISVHVNLIFKNNLKTIWEGAVLNYSKVFHTKKQKYVKLGRQRKSC